MSITNADHLCINCMREKADDGVCPFCGFDESKYEPSPHHLPPRSILGGKCLIGRVLGEGGFGITYMGWDLNLDLKLAIKEYYPRDSSRERTPRPIRLRRIAGKKRSSSRRDDLASSTRQKRWQSITRCPASSPCAISSSKMELPIS